MPSQAKWPRLAAALPGGPSGGTGLQDHVRVGLRGAADAGEAAVAQHLGESFLPGLGAEREAHLLRLRRRHAGEGREAVENLAEQVEILLERVAGERFDDHEA